MTHHEILVQLLDFAAVVVSLTEITAEKMINARKFSYDLMREIMKNHEEVCR